MDRQVVIDLINTMGLTGVGVEVGVQKGHSSRRFLGETKLSRLYSIDSWHTFNSEEYPEFGNVPWWKHVIFYCQTWFNLKKFGGRGVILCMTSVEASKLFMDNSLDFVFIDANHTYKAVWEDLQTWFPKLKSGGLFSGDDYLNGTFKFGTFGVKQAVDEFIKKHNLKLNVACVDSEFPLWYVINNEGGL